MRFTGIRRKGASDGTQSWQEVVQNAPRTSNPGQWAQRKKPSRTTVDMGNAFVVYYESRKRELKIWVMNESRCDTWGCAGGNGERGNSLSFNEQRQRGMLPRASVHAEDVNSIEELNRQRVQAGQIVQFSWSGHPLAMFLVCPFASLYREVKMGTYSERSILCRTRRYCGERGSKFQQHWRSACDKHAYGKFSVSYGLQCFKTTFFITSSIVTTMFITSSIVTTSSLPAHV